MQTIRDKDRCERCPHRIVSSSGVYCYVATICDNKEDFVSEKAKVKTKRCPLCGHVEVVEQ